MKNLLLVLLALLSMAVTPAYAEGDTGPAVDLVQMFGNAPDIMVDGIKLTTVMNVKYKRVQIREVYNDIYYNGVGINQIVCRTSWYYDESTSKVVPTVMWSVWYRPSAMVSMGTTCVDTKIDKKFVDTWTKKGYRWLGSGVEPHMHLIWMDQWTEIQKGYSPAKTPSYKWCKALQFSYAQNMSSETIWTEIYKKSVFDYTQASSALALVSRDVACTSDVTTYVKWMRTPGWNYVFINP